MTSKNLIKLFAFFVFLCGMAAGGEPYFVDPNSNAGHESYGWQIGGGVLVNQRPYKGIDPRVIGIPFIMYDRRDWSLKGTRFDYKLANDGPWAMKTLLRLNTDGYDSNDSSFLRGMSDRHITLDAGLQFSYTQKWGIVSFEGLSDILGVNDGQRLSLRYSKPLANPFGIKKLVAIPFVGAEWQSTSLNDYYYGVRPKEAIPGRPAYNASDDFNYFLGVTCNYRLNKKWSVFGMCNFKLLGENIQNSPIVNKDYQNTFIGGLLYRF